MNVFCNALRDSVKMQKINLEKYVTKTVCTGYINESTREEERECFSPKKILRNTGGLYSNI